MRQKVEIETSDSPKEKKSEDAKPQLPTQEIAQESDRIEEKNLEEVQPSTEKKESYKILIKTKNKTNGMESI